MSATTGRIARSKLALPRKPELRYPASSPTNVTSTVIQKNERDAPSSRTLPRFKFTQ